MDKLTLKDDKTYTHNQDIEDGICIKCKSDDVECLENCTKHVCVYCKFTMWDVTEDSYKAEYDNRPCPICSELVKGEGIFSTGTPLKHHQPFPSELLKNVWMECEKCGWNQYS